MKRVVQILIVLLFSCLIIYLGFNYKSGVDALCLYRVYLDGEVIGTIESKEELENYIDEQGKLYKEKYNIDKIYAPNGLEMKKMTTYTNEVDSIEEIYRKIIETDTFTISCFTFELKTEDSSLIINTLTEDIFTDGVEGFIKSFVGDEAYENYKNGTIKDFSSTGKKIETIEIIEDVTKKDSYVSVNEKIYTDSEDLTKFLLFGDDFESDVYKVKSGDTIETVAFDHKISTNDFLLSNPAFTNENNLLFPGQEVVINMTNPQISVVVEEYEVVDKTIDYKTTYKYDETKPNYEEDVLQDGEDGIDRVTQRNKVVNGVINYVSTISVVEIKPTIDKVVLKGKKVISSVGNMGNLVWPTESGYTITSGFAYRINPITGRYELHSALDIQGGKAVYGSNIYAIANGVVSFSGWESMGGGNYVCVNHNNGYYSCYAHLSSRLVAVGTQVERGDVVGYMGQTGAATGPHLHFEIWVGKPWGGGYRVSPWLYY